MRAHPGSSRVGRIWGKFSEIAPHPAATGCARARADVPLPKDYISKMRRSYGRTLRL